MRLRGGGSALPGLIVEKIDSKYLARSLSKLPKGVVLVSGTNGKTTTTKMVVELLEGQGLKVFTNRTGSNFTRGVVAALLKEVSWSGNLDADIAVLELDEAHATHFVKAVAPNYSLLLNVMRDQLDRFGEIDHTTKLLEVIARHTKDGLTLNREDSRVRNLANSTSDLEINYFGLSQELLETFPDDESLHSNISRTKNDATADVELESINGSSATFLFDDIDHTVELKLTGKYNIFNAAAAIACVRNILKDKIDTTTLMGSLSSITPAFGRGETIMLGEDPIELVLVKNPSGFRLGLSSFDPNGYATMVAINDQYADGRDMSWLWDVDFNSLTKNGVQQISGSRAYDMALRLDYDDVPFGQVGTDLIADLRSFIEKTKQSPKRIYCTYTAMLAIRKELSAYTNVKGLN